MIGFFAAAIAAFFVLAYFQVPILGWTVAGGALLAWLSVVAEFGPTTNVVLAAVFPFAFFYGAVYTEALFLAAVVWAFYCFRTDRWIAGGLCGALATAPRVNGILMLPALAWIAWRRTASTAQTASDRRSDRLHAAVGLLLVCSGIAGYSLYIYRLTGSPFEWVATMKDCRGFNVVTRV